MGFKDNLVNALEIEALAGRLDRSFGAPGTERRIDKEAAQALLEKAGYALRNERDLVLFLPETEDAGEGIVVLDNDLPLYRTTMEDIALRKSPTVKEMLSFRNVKRILNDADVVESKQQDTVRTLSRRYLDRLDLRFEEGDVASLVRDGLAALEGEKGEAVVETLRLFGALLGFKAPPGTFLPEPRYAVGEVSRKPGGEVRFGPAVVFDEARNRLIFVEAPVSSRDADDMKRFAERVSGGGKGDIEGPAVFEELGRRVLTHLPGRRYTPSLA